jgi:hypothetical protein
MSLPLECTLTCKYYTWLGTNVLAYFWPFEQILDNALKNFHGQTLLLTLPVWTFPLGNIKLGRKKLASDKQSTEKKVLWNRRMVWWNGAKVTISNEKIPC